MRSSIPYKRFLGLGLAVLVLFSLPRFLVEQVRGSVVGRVGKLLPLPKKDGSAISKEQERLERENQLLFNEISKIRLLLEQQEERGWMHATLQLPSLSPRRKEELCKLLELEAQSVSAQVLFRDPGSWSSALWVNVGNATNRTLGRCLIQKNSPVIVGRALVGIVDWVGESHCRIRLITDVALKPAVRAVRGTPHHFFLGEQIDRLTRYFKQRPTGLKNEEQKLLIALLERVKDHLLKQENSHYLAKGILQGAGTPLWRSRTHRLRGLGFNYDHADAEGPARDLATGKVSQDPTSTPLPLIAVHDLLVTSGLDGLFPPGLLVAETSKVYPLREGAYTYEIEAIPAVSHLDTLQTVFILPSLAPAAPFLSTEEGI